MVSSPLIRPAIYWGNVALGGVPLDSHDKLYRSNQGVCLILHGPSKLCQSLERRGGTSEDPTHRWVWGSDLEKKPRRKSRLHVDITRMRSTSHFVGFVVLVVVIVVILSAYPHYSWYVNIMIHNNDKLVVWVSGLGFESE